MRTYQCTSRCGFSPGDRIQRRARALGVLRGLAAVAKRRENGFTECGNDVRRHGRELTLIEGGEIRLVHLREKLLDYTCQRSAARSRRTFADSFIPAGRQLLDQQKLVTLMIRVKVPLDLHAVALGGSGAFVLATPMRVRDLLEFAVREAIGARAPHDKFSRSVYRTLAGLAAGDFIIEVDGRTFTDADAIIVCEGTADIRFSQQARRTALHRR